MTTCASGLYAIVMILSVYFVCDGGDVTQLNELSFFGCDMWKSALINLDIMLCRFSVSFGIFMLAVLGKGNVSKGSNG